MIGAVIAMQSEADVLLNEMKIIRTLTVSGKKVYVGTAFDKEIAVCVCGVGKVNAALGTQLLVSKFDAEKILNIGVATASIPNTGVSLPFFSYGGSSIVTLFAAMGIVSGIKMHALPERLRR